MLDALISAGAKLLGGFMGSNATKDANAQSLAFAREQMAAQKEFAQHGLTWKIDDAFRPENLERVHPIYSMGSSGSSYTPVSAAFSPDTAMANAVAGAGQDIGRAVHATSSSSQRKDAFTDAVQKLTVEKGTLENDLLKMELASKVGRLRQNATPPFPVVGDNYSIPGQAQSGDNYIKPKPLEVAPADPRLPSAEGGAISDTGYARTTTGWAPVPSKDVKERIEDNIPAELMHFFRNNILPTFGYNRAPPPGIKLKDDERWIFHFPTQEYRVVKKGENHWNIR